MSFMIDEHKSKISLFWAHSKNISQGIYHEKNNNPEVIKTEHIILNLSK